MWSIAGTILKNIGTAEDIEECVADVFVYLWQNPQKYDAQRGKLKSYLAIIARSKATDKYRQLSRQKEIPLDDTLFYSAELTDDLLSADKKRKLVAAIRSLNEADREILVRRYYYDQKPKEIAFSLDIPKKQVENRLYTTKQKLRSLIIYSD